MDWKEMERIINDIIEITKRNLVRWNTEYSNGVPYYTTMIGVAQISISRQYESMDDEYDYSFNIYNSNGDSIYFITTSFQDRDNQQMLNSLFEAAENSSLQRQMTFDSIKETIKQIKSQNIF